jgi:hypothetical protein
MEESAVTYFKIFRWYSPGGTAKKHINLGQQSRFSDRSRTEHGILELTLKVV